MARKAKEEFKKHIIDLKEYQWDFIRNDKEYIADCEKWSGRKKEEWRSSEIVIGYKLNGNFNDIVYLGNKAYSKVLWNYYDRHSVEWGNLITTSEEVKMIQAKGLCPPETKKQFTWNSYWKKWGINLPLSPLCDHVPFFVNIQELDIITESHCGRGEEKNDLFLERGTKSSIEVNWKFPKEYIKFVFEGILNTKHFLLKEKGVSIDKLPPLKKLRNYLKIWKLKEDGKTSLEIAEQVYPVEAGKNLRSAINRVNENYKSIKKLGYGVNRGLNKRVK